MHHEARDEDLATSRPSREAYTVERRPEPTAGRERGSRPGRITSGPWLPLPGWLNVRRWGESGGEEATDNEILIDELRTQVHQLRNQIRDARHEADEARGKLHAEQEANRRLTQTVKEMETERDNMNVSVKKQEAQIRQLQALAFEGIGSDSWAAGDDSTARADLENLHSRLKNWAKKYAIGEMSEVRGLTSDEHASLIRLLAEVVRLRSGVPNASGIEHLQAGPMNRKSPAVCIQGLLSHHVYANIVNQPFFALGDAGRALENVYRAIIRVNENESHMWRSRTLRLLATPPADVQQGDERHLHNHIASQKAVCRRFASEFYDSPAKHLVKSAGKTDPQCFHDLESIVQYAGELSYRLWTRRTLTCVMSLPELCSQPFNVGSDIMKAHPLHRLYEDDDRCDGWFVSVVAHPAIVAYGSSDGKDYSSGRVWMKAEVWLDEDSGVKLGAP